MAKKTKKQKIIAQYRRKLQLIEQQKRITNNLKESVKSDIFDKKREEEYNSNQNLILNTSYFLSDLKKSLFISFLIIALEISLYFVKLIK